MGFKKGLQAILTEALYFNDLRPIFSRLIFQPVNVFIDVNFNVSFKKGLQAI